MRQSALLATTMLSLAFAPAPLPKPDMGKDDLKKMQGTWEVTAFRVAGATASPGVGKVVIAGDRMTYHNLSGGLATQWVLDLDAKKSPRTFAWKRIEPPHQVAFWGSYLLDKDTLTICYVGSKAERPADLEGKKPGQCVEVLRRIKR